MGCLYFVDGKKRHLGYFAVEAEAAEAYNEAGNSTGGGGCRFGCRESAKCAEYIFGVGKDKAFGTFVDSTP